jgi:hypothetical protein
VPGRHQPGVHLLVGEPQRVGELEDQRSAGGADIAGLDAGDDARSRADRGRNYFLREPLSAPSAT